MGPVAAVLLPKPLSPEGRAVFEEKLLELGVRPEDHRQLESGRRIARFVEGQLPQERLRLTRSAAPAASSVSVSR